MNRTAIKTLVAATLAAGTISAFAATGEATPTPPTTTTTTTAPATTTTEPATTTSTTTTTTTAPATTVEHDTYGVDHSCPQYEQLAADIGWPHDQIAKLSHIMWRESRCHPTSWNHSDPMGGSMGLVQINRFWCLPTSYHPQGWLEEQGVLTDCDQLLDPATALRAALAIQQHSGWAPWGG